MVLVAAGSVSVVKLIFSLAVAINAAASKARRNKADCLDIATRATTLDAALSSLEEPAGGGAKAKHPAVAAALEGLHLALHRALQAVMNCQEDGAVSRHVNADRVSAELRRVNQVITDRMMDVVLVAGLHTNSVVVLDAHQSKHRGAADGGSPLPRPLPQIQEASFPNSCKEEKLSATSGFNSFDFSELEGATNKFSEENLIGKSDSCTVYKGELPNGSEVAVKEYNKNQYKACRNECQNEENLAAKLLHKNILKLEGRCSSGGRCYQVYPYMHNRSLSKHIHGNGLPWPELFNIIRGIARGADYLHEQCGLGIIHLHLKPSSILLDYDYTPKICYFGNSKVLPASAKEGVVDSVVRPCGFAAPEYIKSGRFSAKSDVYSFGVLLLELVTGWSRYRKGDDNRDERLNELVWEFWQNGREDDCVDPMLARATGRMGLQFQEMKRCINVALLCLEEDPLLRPDMAAVLRMLADNDNPMPRPQHPAYTT